MSCQIFIRCGYLLGRFSYWSHFLAYDPYGVHQCILFHFLGVGMGLHLTRNVCLYDVHLGHLVSNTLFVLSVQCQSPCPSLVSLSLSLIWDSLGSLGSIHHGIHLLIIIWGEMFLLQFGEIITGRMDLLHFLNNIITDIMYWLASTSDFPHWDFTENGNGAAVSIKYIIICIVYNHLVICFILLFFCSSVILRSTDNGNGAASIKDISRTLPTLKGFLHTYHRYLRHVAVSAYDILPHSLTQNGTRAATTISVLHRFLLTYWTEAPSASSVRTYLQLLGLWHKQCWRLIPLSPLHRCIQCLLDSVSPCETSTWSVDVPLLFTKSFI